MAPPRRDVYERFMEKVKVSATGCWQWTSTIKRDGYPGFWLDGAQLAHRVSYELHVGPIPTGLTIDHLCENRSCVNPEHLQVVTRAENTSRARKGKSLPPRPRSTHCKRGHEYTTDNTLPRPGGRRECKACNNHYQRERWREKHWPGYQADL